MSFDTDLNSLFTAGFNQLFSVYGKSIDIIEHGSGDPYLFLPGGIEEIETNIKALVFPLTVWEMETYGTGFGMDSKKFLFATDIALNTRYLIRSGIDMYEIFKITDRVAFNRYRVIGKKSEDV